MRNYMTKSVSLQELTSITCDVCKGGYDDILDLQEFHRISGIGGYCSAIGDCVQYECDICSKCLNQLLGKYLRIEDECEVRDG